MFDHIGAVAVHGNASIRTPPAGLRVQKRASRELISAPPCSYCYDVPTLVGQMEAAGKSWRAYDATGFV
jgi:hypothetical protein